jgi:hypothetical protein
MHFLGSYMQQYLRVELPKLLASYRSLGHEAEKGLLLERQRG